MTVRGWVVVVALWLVSLAGVAAVAQGGPPQVATLEGALPPAGVVIAGNDLGFRVDYVQGKTRYGRLVVRVDNEWVDTQFAMMVKPVK